MNFATFDQAVRQAAQNFPANKGHMSTIDYLQADKALRDQGIDQPSWDLIDDIYQLGSLQGATGIGVMMHQLYIARFGRRCAEEPAAIAA